MKHYESSKRINLVMPIFFFSGALFPLESLPKAIKIIAKLDTLTYGVDGLRLTLVSGMHLALLHDFIILASITFIFLLVGSYLFSKIEI